MNEKLIKIHRINGNLNSILKVIGRRNVYVARSIDGTCIILNKYKSFKEIEFVKYNPNFSEHQRGRCRLNIEALSEVLSVIGWSSNMYSHFEFNQNGNNISSWKNFDTISDVLSAVETGRVKGYNVGIYDNSMAIKKGEFTREDFRVIEALNR